MIIMPSKKELLKECYKVNEKEYYQLFARKPRDFSNYGNWRIFYKSVLIHDKLNDLFESNPFLSKLIFSNGYSELLSDKNEYGCIGNLTSNHFDHTISIRLSDDVSEVSCSDTVTGIITFPYFQKWSDVKRWIDDVPETFSVYIINPRLIFYGVGTIGLFLAPKYYNGTYIELCNRFIIGLTGFPLFLTYSLEEKVEEITYIDLELSKENFVNELYSLSNDNKGLLKMLNFWKHNEDVSIPMFEDIYQKYLDVQPYWAYDTINFIKIHSKRPFKLVHEDNNEILGTFKEFSLDGPFKLIDTENGAFKLSDMQVKDLLDGKYDFKLISGY